MSGRRGRGSRTRRLPEQHWLLTRTGTPIDAVRAAIVGADAAGVVVVRTDTGTSEEARPPAAEWSGAHTDWPAHARIGAVAGDKHITDAQHRGSQGERVAGVLLGDTGHEWHPTGRNEAGVDGFLDLRDQHTGRMSAQILIVQVKTTAELLDEDELGFSWRANPGDLAFWEGANAPVIVVVIRERPQEGWWKAVDEAFAGADERAARVVRFDKSVDRLTEHSGQALWSVAERGRDRAAAAARMMIAGPYATGELGGRLAEAQAHMDADRWPQGAEAWMALADEALAARLDRRLTWPALEQAARAFERAGDGHRAGQLWLRIATERVDDDAPESFDTFRASWTPAWTGDFDQQLLSARVSLPEHGVDQLDDLRELTATRRVRAPQRQAAAAALVDALIFYGYHAEAHEAADRVLGRRHDTQHKRQLALERVDCAGRLGLATKGDDWRPLLADLRDRGPLAYGPALQRHAIALLREGDLDGARDRFAAAADLWSLLDGGARQTAEVAWSSSEVDMLGGVLAADVLPFGARAAAAIATGSVRTPAVRSDRLGQSGMALLADERYAEAIGRVTLAAMVDRRAGNLSSWRRHANLLARVYHAADEPAEALRMWLAIGHETRCRERAGDVAVQVLLQHVALLDLEHAPAWEQAAAWAALASTADRLSVTDVASLEDRLVVAAGPAPSFVAPQPSVPARRLLAQVADRLSARHGEQAGKILTEDVRSAGPPASDASAGLMRLHHRGLFEAFDVLVDAVLDGAQLPVTIRAWLRDGDEEIARRVTDAALSGNRVALEEAAAADLPEANARLAERCRELICEVIAATSPAPSDGFASSWVDLADVARHAGDSARTAFVNLLVATVEHPEQDEVTKTSALLALAITAPALDAEVADVLIDRLLPTADGGMLTSAPAVMGDHRNIKRAHSKMTRRVPPLAVRRCAIQACGRLAVQSKSRRHTIAGMLERATNDADPEVVRMALRELVLLPDVLPDLDLERWREHPHDELRASAVQLSETRSTA